MFKNKTLMITGGTGSFGKTILENFIEYDFDEIRIFSRDEKKQDDLRKHFHSDRIKFYIGDVRDKASIESCISDVNYIFHAAALKQVPSCEFFPMEAVKTNIHGTSNVIDLAIKNSVEKVIVLSTDKAVYPINAMGISKAMMEKVAISKSKLDHKTIINITRYGNVMASRGSVIPLFINQIQNNNEITITDPNMTRFMMNLNEAVNLVLYSLRFGKQGEIFVQKSSAASVQTLALAMIELIGNKNTTIKNIGTRHGEKLYESLLSREEMMKSKSHEDYFSVEPDSRTLNYDKFYTDGNKEISQINEYNSHNTNQLSVDEMKKMLLQLPVVKNAIDALKNS